MRKKKLREAYDNIDAIYNELIDIFYAEIDDFIHYQLPIQKIDAILEHEGYSLPDNSIDEVDNPLDEYKVNTHVLALAELLADSYIAWYE